MPAEAFLATLRPRSDWTRGAGGIIYIAIFASRDKFLSCKRDTPSRSGGGGKERGDEEGEI